MAATQTKTQKDLSASFVNVSPTKAKKWLKKNHENRPLRENQVSRYAKLMEESEWITSPDAIAFDTEGRLINGQHRLEAVVESGQTIEDALVVWGLPKDAFKIADVGAKRTAADVLHIEGFKHPQEMGAIMKLVALWAEDRLEQCGQYEVVEKFKIVDAAEVCTDRVYESIELVQRHKEFIRNGLPRSIAAFAHFLFKGTYQEKADDFVKEAFGEKAAQPDWIVTEDGVKTIFELENEGVDVEETYPEGHEDRYDSPAYLLRQKAQDGDYPREKWLAWTIQAMNWYCTEDPHGRLRYRSSDRMPTPEVDVIPEIQKKMDLFS
jgi:hypothetical protein